MSSKPPKFTNPENGCFVRHKAQCGFQFVTLTSQSIRTLLGRPSQVGWRPSLLVTRECYGMADHAWPFFQRLVRLVRPGPLFCRAQLECRSLPRHCKLRTTRSSSAAWSGRIDRPKRRLETRRLVRPRARQWNMEARSVKRVFVFQVPYEGLRAHAVSWILFTSRRT